MYLLPHILYVFRTLPIPFLRSHLNKLQAIWALFIWNGKCLRIKRSTLCSTISTGGMGAPNISAYFKAIVLDQAKSWWQSDTQRSWQQIESTVLANNLELSLGASLLQHRKLPQYSQCCPQNLERSSPTTQTHPSSNTAIYTLTCFTVYSI